MLSCSEGFRLPLGAIDRVRVRVGSELIVELYRGVSSSSRAIDRDRVRVGRELIVELRGFVFL